AGEAYERLRMKLTFFFESRAGASAADLVDATIDRAARKTLELKSREEAIRNPVAYIRGIAHFILMEHNAARNAVPLEVDPPQPGVDDVEQMHDALERCLERLKPDQRELIREFYQGEKAAKKNARARLAERLDITMNALSLRAFHIRQKLEKCLETR